MHAHATTCRQYRTKEKGLASTLVAPCSLPHGELTMRFIRRLIIATAQWVALLSIFVVTFSGGVSGWSWVLGDPNTDDKWGYVGFLAGAFIGFAIAATLAGAYFCLVEIAYNTRQQSEPRGVCNFVAE